MTYCLAAVRTLEGMPLRPESDPESLPSGIVNLIERDPHRARLDRADRFSTGGLRPVLLLLLLLYDLAQYELG